MKLLLDEHFPPLISEALRRQGHEVIAVVEIPELRGMVDVRLLEHATGQERAMVTNDLRDFVRIAREWAASDRRHAGILLIAPPLRRVPGELIRRLAELLDHHDSLRGELRWL